MSATRIVRCRVTCLSALMASLVALQVSARAARSLLILVQSACTAPRQLVFCQSLEPDTPKHCQLLVGFGKNLACFAATSICIWSTSAASMALSSSAFCAWVLASVRLSKPAWCSCTLVCCKTVPIQDNLHSGHPRCTPGLLAVVIDVCGQFVPLHYQASLRVSAEEQDAPGVLLQACADMPVWVI